GRVLLDIEAPWDALEQRCDPEREGLCPYLALRAHGVEQRGLAGHVRAEHDPLGGACQARDVVLLNQQLELPPGNDPATFRLAAQLAKTLLVEAQGVDSLWPGELAEHQVGDQQIGALARAEKSGPFGQPVRAGQIGKLGDDLVWATGAGNHLLHRTHELAVDTGQIHHARLDPPSQSGVLDGGRDGRVQCRAVDVYQHQPREVPGQLFQRQVEGLPRPQYDCELPALA